MAGEYTVLLSGDALAIPFEYYSGAWRAGIRSTYPFDLDNWIEHLSLLKEEDIHLDINRMHLDYEKDIRFVSNIPQGGGLGSSGAITAAFYDRYVFDDKSLEDELDEVRRVLSHMEAYFHGRSSGVDPLVSLTGQTFISLDGTDQLRTTQIPQSIRLHIIHTQTERNTGPLIEYFMDAMENKPKFQETVNEELIPAVKRFISAWIEGRTSEMETVFQQISQLEWELLKPMISKEIKALWKQSLEDENFSLKLCGAGGGGAYLALGELPESMKLKSLEIKSV